MIAYTTSIGLPVYFEKDDSSNCSNCKYKANKLFTNKKNKCNIILGLTVDSNFGRCSLYENTMKA